LRTSGLALALVLLAGCSGGTRSRRPDGLDVSNYPEEVQTAYGVFEYRCSRCHSLARPLNAEIDDAAFWADYVARMRRMPGSGINRRDADVILRFLTYYTDHRESGGALPFRRIARRGAP